MKLLFKGGTIVSGEGCRICDLLTDGEQIAQVGENLTCPEAQIVDVRGMVLLPGFIDAHTHFDLDVCNTTTADDFASGTRAALRGGTTTIIDFACPNKGESLAHGLSLWQKKAADKAACDYGFHMTIDDWNDGIRAEIPQMLEAGIPTFKLYMTYPAMMIGEDAMFCALQELKKHGALAGVHCEDSAAIDGLITEKKAAGHLSPASHPAVRPNKTEAEAINRLLRMAQEADTPVIVVHLSTKEGLAEIRAARACGQTVYAETCPHYLLLDESHYFHKDPLEAAKYVCAPPLRTTKDQNALWQALADGAIQTVATDHCSFTLAQKLVGLEDFTKIPGGLPSVESRGILLWSEGVSQNRLSAEMLCKLLSENPAKLYGLYPRKGVLLPGSDADIVVLNPNEKGLLTAADQASRAGYCPYEGLPTNGVIEQVYLRGELAVCDGKFQTTPRGIYLHRTPGTLN